MAVAHDTDTRFPATENTSDTTSGNRTFTHTPVGTPAGVVVAVCGSSTAAVVTGVLYGGVAMTSQGFATDTVEVGSVEIFSLTDQSIPTGAQTVTLQGCTTTPKFATCSTVISATGQTTRDTNGFKNTTSTTNPFIELTYTQPAIMYGAMHWGGTTWPTTPLTGQTDQNHVDYGALSAITARRTSEEAAGAHRIGWTTSTEDHCLVAVALAEKSTGTSANAGEVTVASAANATTSQVASGIQGVTASASANNPTITTGKNVDAVVATSTVSVGDLSAKTSPTAGDANASSAAQNASISTSISRTPTEATASVSAQNASVSTSQNAIAGQATASASAQNASINVQPASTYDGVVIGDAPVSFWNDDSGTDAMGLSNLTKVNSPTSGQAPDGTACMVFNGTNQYAEGTDQDAYSVPTTGRLTYEAWIRPDTLEFPNDESTGYVHWAGKTGSGTTNDAEWQMRMYSKVTTDVPPRPNRISGYAYNPDGGQGTGGYFQDSIALGEWIHVVFVINKADAGGSYPNGYGKLYKNGVLRRQDDLNFGGVPINPGNGTAPFRVGTTRLASYFKGAIAKSAIYNYELSQTQISEHFNTMKLVQGLAQDATIATESSPLAADGTGVANNATVSITGGTNAQAQTASVTGQAVNASISTSETGEAVEATASAIANNASISTSETGEAITATATGSANDAIVDFSIRVNPQGASASGSANNATIKVSPNLSAAEVVAIAENAVGAIAQYAFAGAAGVIGTANDTSTTRTGNANAQLAAAIGEALAIKAAIGADGATALGAGVVWPPFKITGGVEVATSVMAVRDDSDATDLVSAGIASTLSVGAANKGVFALSTNASTSTVTD